MWMRIMLMRVVASSLLSRMASRYDREGHVRRIERAVIDENL